MTTATTPPSDQHVLSALRRRRRLTLRYIDHNRPLQILALLLIYLLAIHYIFKFGAFHLPHSASKIVVKDDGELLLGIRGGRRRTSSAVGVSVGVGVMGFSYPKISLRNCHHQRCSKKIATSLKSPENVDTLEGRDATTEKETSCHKHKRKRIPVLSYEDNYVIVSKPAGMTMHQNSNSRWGRSKKPVLQSTIKKQLCRKPFLVHRLDHRTSGALVVAFNSETAASLHGRLKKGIKLYVALVRGDLREKFKSVAAAGNDVENGIDLSVKGGGSVIGGRERISQVVANVTCSRDREAAVLDASEYNSKITVNLPIQIDGIDKEAQTDFYFLSSVNLYEETDDTEGPYVTKSLSLLLCRPITGKTHQIRRHAVRGLNCPIIGDSEHGDSRVNRFWRERFGFNRLGLHCFYLELPPNSDNDDVIKCIAPLTDDFQGSLACDELSTLWKEAVRVLPSLQLDPYDECGRTFGRNYRRRKQSENASL